MAVPRLLQGLKKALQQSAGGRHRVKMARCRLKGRSCYILSWLRDGQGRSSRGHKGYSMVEQRSV
jgi:hypothetical protein